MGIGGAAGRQQPHGAAICHQLTNQHIVLDRCTAQSGQKAKEEVPRSARLKKTNASTKPDTLWLQIGTVMLIISHRQDVLKLLECWGQPSNTSASASPQGSNGRAHHEVTCSIWVILATTDYCTLAHLCGITRSTVCSIVHEFACSISEAIKLPEGMKFHTLEPLTEVISPPLHWKNIMFSRISISIIRSFCSGMEIMNSGKPGYNIEIVSPAINIRY